MTQINHNENATRIHVTKYSSCDHVTLIAKFDICVERWGSLHIRNLCLFSKDNKRWIAFPSFLVEENKFEPLLRFESSSMMNKFSELVLEAIDQYLEVK